MGELFYKTCPKFTKFYRLVTDGCGMVLLLRAFNKTASVSGLCHQAWGFASRTQWGLSPTPHIVKSKQILKFYFDIRLHRARIGYSGEDTF